MFYLAIKFFGGNNSYLPVQNYKQTTLKLVFLSDTSQEFLSM